LLNTIPKYQEKGDIAFKVAYLSLIAYLQQDKNLPCEFLFDSIKEFVQLKVTEISINEANYKYLYSSMSFLNLVFLMPNSTATQNSRPLPSYSHGDPLSIRSSRGRGAYAFAGGKGGRYGAA
jgi:hypothetical protein